MRLLALQQNLPSISAVSALNIGDTWQVTISAPVADGESIAYAITKVSSRDVSGFALSGTAVITGGQAVLLIPIAYNNAMPSTFPIRITLPAYGVYKEATVTNNSGVNVIQRLNFENTNLFYAYDQIGGWSQFSSSNKPIVFTDNTLSGSNESFVLCSQQINQNMYWVGSNAHIGAGDLSSDFEISFLFKLVGLDTSSPTDNKGVFSTSRTMPTTGDTVQIWIGIGGNTSNQWAWRIYCKKSVGSTLTSITKVSSTAISTYNDGLWHKVSMTRSGSDVVRLSVDGVQQSFDDSTSSGSFSGTVPIYNAETLQFGLWSSSASQFSLALDQLQTIRLPVYALSIPSPVFAGSTHTILLTATNIADGTQIGYIITGTGITSANIGTALSGVFTVSSGTASLSIAPTTDAIGKTFTITLIANLATASATVQAALPAGSVLYFNFANGSTDTFGHTATLQNGATISGGKLLIGNGKYLQVSDPSADFTINSGQDFYFRCKFKVTGTNWTTWSPLVGSASTAWSSGATEIAANSGSHSLRLVGYPNSTGVGATMSQNVDYDYIVSRDGASGIVKEYLNGSMTTLSSGSFGAGLTFSHGGALMIGRHGWSTSDSYFPDAEISELLLVKGHTYTP